MNAVCARGVGTGRHTDNGAITTNKAALHILCILPDRGGLCRSDYHYTRSWGSTA